MLVLSNNLRSVIFSGTDLAGGGPGASSLGVTKWETVKA